MKKILAIALLSASVTATASPLVKYACSGCHGVNGEGSVSGPKLQGLDADYIVAQLKAFQNGSRVNPVMQPMSMMAIGHEQEIADFLAGEK
jgi:cytochrome c553